MEVLGTFTTCQHVLADTRPLALAAPRLHSPSDLELSLHANSTNYREYRQHQ